MTTPETLLIFRIAGIACAVPAESVGSIVMPPPHLTHPPGSGRSTPGIFHHADYTYSVIDLHERFGIDTPRQGSGRLLLQNDGIRHFAFWVDEIVGLVRSEQGQWASLPPYLPGELFWSGFLYRKEIVLCTELHLLRSMHDAEPLRRHFEALQQQRKEQREEPTQEKNTAQEKPPASIQTSIPREPSATVTETAPTTTREAGLSTTVTSSAENKTPKEKSRPVRPVTRNETHAAAASNTPPPRKAAPNSGKADDKVDRSRPTSPGDITVARSTPPTRPTETPPPSRAEQKPPRQPPPPARSATTDTTETVAQATSRDTTSPAPKPESAPPQEAPLWPWLLILPLLALVAAYGFWLMTAEPPAPRPVKTARPAPIAPPPRERPVAAVPAPVPREEPQPARATNAQPVAETQPVAPPATAKAETGKEKSVPLRIERDEEGTISLIIDRRAIIASRDKPANPFADIPIEGIAAPATRDTADGESESPDATVSGSADTPTEQEPSSTAGEEPPLQAEADWPEPPSPTGLEPCDCTHTVVRGDTLWDIAEHYTGNAFNYPDLARRSGIKNPDRIYPGDKVRIIIR